jgi:SAM-dependent methyltransferase
MSLRQPSDLAPGSGGGGPAPAVRLSAVFDEDITEYYERGNEQHRLRGESRLEFVRTQELLARFLPPAPAAVLDVGGGPGAYAAWLSDLGYDVRLLDPIELHVTQARDLGVTASLGDARALPFDDGTAGAVLLLGPLYHLPDAEDRLRALVEARRVLRRGGVLAAAAITRFASTIDGLLKGYMASPEFEQIVGRVLRDGQHANPDRDDRWFTTAYFHLPDELRDEIRGAGFEPRGVYGIEGPGAWLPDIDGWLDEPDRRGALLRAIARVETEPSMLGASPHLLALGINP